MVSVSFADKAKEVVDSLKAQAAGLGVESSAIEEGHTGQPGAAPFLYVYVLPTDDHEAGQDGLPYKAMAEVTILCGVEGKESASESVKDGMQLAGRVLSVINTLETDYSLKSIALEEQSADSTIVRVTLASEYNPYVDLLT